jgi:hypothetical protein
MQAEELLITLTTAECRLLADGERLRVQDPRQALTNDLREAIRAHKPNCWRCWRTALPTHASCPTPRPSTP